MAKRVSARRYAQAVFELGKKEHITDRQAELEKIASLSKDATIAAYFENTKIHFEDKSRLLHERLSDVAPMILNLIYLLIARKRFSMLPEIATEYQRLVDDYQCIERAEITTAVPLNDEARRNLSQRLSDITGKKVIIESEYVDSSLIGGVVVRVAGKLVDGSTQGKLEALKKKIGK